MTDIEKVFRCIDVHKEDAQYQRVLCREDPGQSVQELYCPTVMFGTASAPYTAIRTIHKLAHDEGLQTYIHKLAHDEGLQTYHRSIDMIKECCSL